MVESESNDIAGLGTDDMFKHLKRTSLKQKYTNKKFGDISFQTLPC